VHIEKGEYLSGDNNGKSVDLCVSIQDARLDWRIVFFFGWFCEV
jgi:hypothetical protein